MRVPKKPAKRPSAQLVKISEEMREYSAMLTDELRTWPEVTDRLMFGLRSFYRKGNIFAAVPVTRALLNDRSVIFKLVSPTKTQQRRLEADARIGKTEAVGQKWYAFAIESPVDLRDALKWFDEAYESVRIAK
jgi:hypothetical protein